MTDNGVKLVAKFEGLPTNDPLAAYWDKYGKVWTIGYGATYYLDGSKVNKGDRLNSIDEALSLLKAMLTKYEQKVRAIVGEELFSTLTDSQREALTSLTYNIGAGNFRNSTVLKLIKTNEKDNVAKITKAFGMWNKSGGDVLPGLVKRRSEEAAYYFGNSPAEVNNDSSHPMAVQEPYQGDGNMFAEVSNKNMWDVQIIKDADPQPGPLRKMMKSRAANTTPSMVSSENGWKVTAFKTIPRKSNNWKSLRMGSALPVVGDLLFAYHDGDLTGKHDHVAIFMGIHEGNLYVAEGYSVEGERINEKDKKVQLCKIEDSRLGLDTDIITHFAHHTSPEIKQKEGRQSAPNMVNNDTDISNMDYNGKWFSLRSLKAQSAPDDIKENAAALIQNTLDPLADIYNNYVQSTKNRVHISSGYRDSEHNDSVGGVPGSQHTVGQAADVYTLGSSDNYKENLRLVKFVLENNIPFDQMIIEGVEYMATDVDGSIKSTDKYKFKPRWVHLSYIAPGKKSPKGRTGNRKETLYSSNKYYKGEDGKPEVGGVNNPKPISVADIKDRYNHILG